MVIQDLYLYIYETFVFLNRCSYDFDRRLRRFPGPANPSANPIKKVPVIYVNRPAADWTDVQPIIERIEEVISDHNDTNDYNSSPFVLIKGKVTGWANKRERGKAVELEPEASAQYLTWTQAPDSIEMEQPTLRSLIYAMTNTTDLSFAAVKGFAKFSGITIKMLFMGAHLKAATNQVIVGKFIQRRINFIN